MLSRTLMIATLLLFAITSASVRAPAQSLEALPAAREPAQEE
jgi:hypothetical protein